MANSPALIGKQVASIEPRPTRIGTIHPPRSMFLHEGIGGATDGENKLAISVSFTSKTPLIRSETTGKWFSLSWQEILTLAVEAGIHEPEEHA